MVEGQGAAQDDRADDTVQISHHGRCGYTQGRNTLGCEPFVSCPIACRSIAHIVCHPVDLDGELRLCAIEVEDERAEWMLSPEAEAGRLGPQNRP